MKRIILTAASLLMLSAPVGARGLSLNLGFTGGRVIRPAYRHRLNFHGRLGHSHSEIIERRIEIEPSISIEIGHSRPGGYWEWREVRTWVAGYYEEIHVPAVYKKVWVEGYRTPRGDIVHGHYKEILVRGARNEKIWHPGHYEVERERVWVTVCR